MSNTIKVNLTKKSNVQSIIFLFHELIVNLYDNRIINLENME